MIARRILLIGFFFIAASIYLAQGFSMDEICDKHKARGRCDKGNIKSQCPKQCGGGGGDEPTHPPDGPSKPPKPTPPKPTSKSKSNVNVEHNTTPSSTNGGGGGDSNAKFLARCQALPEDQLKSSCHPHCRYDEDTAAMKKAFLGGPCKLTELRTYLTAASNNKDNTKCCEESGVLSQKKTGVCGCFCNPTGPVWPGKGEAGKYAPCVGVLTGIMQCHSKGS